MRVRLTDIPLEGLSITDSLSLESLNARMTEGLSPNDPKASSEGEILFIDPPKVMIHLVPSGEGVTLAGEITASYKQSCSLCLDTLPRSTVLPVKYQLAPRKVGSEEDDIGVAYFDGDSIDLTELLEEALILSLSLYWHPNFTADRCAQCKRSRSELGLSDAPRKATLGELIGRELNGAATPARK